MKKPALIIKELSIEKMPGFSSGMKSISSLARNINVIAGPNASGKSSTARIIQDMIWRQNTEKIRVQSKLLIDDKKWSIHIDNGHYSSQCDGKDDTLSSIPSYDESKRYFLALHELIGEDDKNLAEEILRETIGGYNLQEAYHTLGYRASTPNLGLGEYKNYEKMRKHVDSIEDKQISLQKEEKKLAPLQEEYEEAKRASNLKQLYERLVDFLRATKSYEVLEEEKSSFPEQMALLKGSEEDAVLKLEQKIEETTQAIDAICREIERKKDELLALYIPEGGYDRVMLDELSEHIDKLYNAERNLEHKRIDIAKNKRETDVVLSNLFVTLTDENLKLLDVENIHDLDNFFEEAHRLLTKKQQLENEIDNLTQKQQKQAHKEEELHHAIPLLLNWFRKDTTAPSTSRGPLWVLLVLGLLTVPLTYFYGWIGLVGVLAMLLFVLFILFKGGNAEAPDTAQEGRENDFKKTGIREPVKWQEEEVSKRLGELHEELHEVKQQNKITDRLEELNNLLEQIEPQFHALDAKRKEWVDKLGSIPALNSQNLESYSGLYWLLKNLHQWQKYNNELQANLIAYEEEDKMYAEIIAHINSVLTELGVQNATDAASAKAILRKMNEDENRRSELLRDKMHSSERKLDFEALNKRNREELHAIYSGLELEVGAKEELRVLLSKKAAYDRLEKELEQARRSRVEKEKQLQNHHLYEQTKGDLPTQINEAVERGEQYVAASNRERALLTEITTIETHIDKERVGHELEIALTEKEEALNDLEQNYRDTINSITGDVIVNSLKKKTQEHSNSQVFNRANKLFNKITHGHYELILDDSEGGNFRAKDMKMGRGQPLDHLSSGTRIQLLIAVRLAFIESQESGVKLPILADEVLANSDDIRATQIIEALIEISKEGRQVFYFTAQTDELKKWQEHLAKHQEIDGKIIVLEGQANDQIDYKLDETVAIPSFQFEDVPLPSNYSNEAYHQLLNPLPYHLLKHKSTELYLSYLIENNNLLYACLQRGIEYYGQLKSYVKHQGKIEGLDDATLTTIDNKVQLLTRYQKLYQTGRPKPIDRAVLQDSGSVSDVFMDAVDAKLKEVDDNPKLLLDALRAGEVPRFMRSKIDELEDYLFRLNYLDGREPLTPEEVTLQLQALLSTMELDSDGAERFLNRVVG